MRRGDVVPFDPLMQPPRRTSLTSVAGLMAAYLALNFLVVLVLFPSGVLRIFLRPTGGLVTSTLLANVLMLAILLSFVHRILKLRWVDLGLGRADVGAGVAATLALWFGVNAFEAVVAWFDRSPITLADGWQSIDGAIALLGSLAAQLFGNAALEEILFRGVLFEQLRLHLQARAGWSPLAALVMALLASQTVFALIHVPLLVTSGVAPDALGGELALLFGLGVLLALLYRRTGNLYVVIGVHALSNAPTLLVTPPLDVSTNGAIAAVASIVLAAAWPRARPGQSPRGMKPPAA